MTRARSTADLPIQNPRTLPARNTSRPALHSRALTRQQSFTMTSRPSHVTVTRHRHTNTVLPCVICMQQQSRHQTSAVNMSGASHRTWQLQKHLHAQRCMTREAACYDPTCSTPHKTRSRAKQTFQCQAMHMTWQLHNHC